MAAFRQEKLSSLIKHRSAEFFRAEIAPGIIVTVTDVVLGSDNHQGIIFISVLPEIQEPSVIKILEKTTGRLKTYIHEHAQIGIVPDLSIQIDRGEKLRQTIDTLFE